VRTALALGGMIALLGALGTCTDAAPPGDGAPAEQVQTPGTQTPGMAMEAEVSPSFDCGAEQLSEAESRICADPDLARLDLELDSVWSAAMGKAEAEGMPQVFVSEARAYQRGWIGGRDECWKAGGYALYEGLPEDEAIHRCIETAYAERIARLRADWGMADVVAGPLFWMCDGNPANAFVTTLYDTEPQAARVERGDQSEIMLRSRTASGARYDGFFGKWFWEKGESATFVWPQTDTLSCVARAG